MNIPVSEVESEQLSYMYVWCSCL